MVGSNPGGGNGKGPDRLAYGMNCMDTGHYRVLDVDDDRPGGFHFAACPACLGERWEPLFCAPDHYTGREGEFAIVRCLECGFVYTNPRPGPEALSAFYPDEAGYYQPKDADPASLRREVTNGPLARKLRRLGYGASPVRSEGCGRPVRRLLAKGFPRYVPGGRLLEVGCSYGKFLYQLECLGWQVEGVELNSRAADVARRRLGLSVRSSPLETLSLPAEAYDAVILRMVLEHLPSPVDALAQLREATRPGGQLVAIVPNFASLANDWFGRYCYNLHAPAHMSHFTPRSVGEVMARAGFEVRDVCPIHSTRDILESARIRGERQGEDILSRLARRRRLGRSLARLVLAWASWTGRASRMAVHAVRR
jgi:2-polyprenyl-3-methyl-5-hydroxy-6-metoxy-1,4-benzoquinol methylase